MQTALFVFLILTAGNNYVTIKIFRNMIGENMGLGIFNKLSSPIVLKEDSNAEEQLRQMEYYQLVAPEATKQAIERDKAFVKYGIAGENAIMYELKNSHIPMYIIHDLYLEYNGCTAQIDFLIVTRKVTILIESKNLYGNIFVDNSGNFIRRTGNGKTFRQEGMYSPVTQNERHLALIKEMRRDTKNFFTRGMFESNFHNNYRSLIVMANTKSIIDYRYAPKDIKDKIVKVDGLVRKIKEICSDSSISEMSDYQMQELADFFMAHHTVNKTDYTSKYQDMINKETSDAPFFYSFSVNQPNNTYRSQTVSVPVPTPDTSGFDTASSTDKTAGYENLPIYKALRQYRYEKSKAENIKAYYVFKNDELIEIIRLMPTVPEQLRSIRGFGEGKIQKYGYDIINIVNKYR